MTAAGFLSKATLGIQRKTLVIVIALALIAGAVIAVIIVAGQDGGGSVHTLPNQQTHTGAPHPHAAR